MLEVPRLVVERPSSPTASTSAPSFEVNVQPELGPDPEFGPDPEPRLRSEPLASFSFREPELEPDPEPDPSEPATPLELILNSLILEDDDNEFEVEPELSDSETTPNNAKANHPLFEGSNISVHESMVSILTLALAFKITGVCLQAILRLISLHLPKVNNFRTSLYLFKDYFSYLQGPKSYEYYCSKCFEKLEPKTSCSSCSKSKVCCLVKLSLVSQLQTMFKRKNFYSKLNFECSVTEDKISDVYDGQLYQDLVKKMILGIVNALSFQWYTDGAALYSSSKVSVWPFYLTIDQLPYSDRYKKENLLVPCIWSGPVKPPGNLLLRAIFPELQSIFSGVKFEVDSVGEKFVKGVLLSGTGDTPARSMMLNMVQYNGASACQVCEQPGVPRPNVPGVRLFPYKPEDMVPRTVSKMLEYGSMGTLEKPFLGVKGHTLLSKMMPDFVKGTAVDPMHQLYGGCGKKLLKLWTTTKKKDSGKWSISKNVNTLNSRLLSIKPPIHTPRFPQSLLDLAYYKMSELKAWFNEYSLPVLKGILPDSYLVHHSTLVAAVQLLSADVVPNSSIYTARQLLAKYVDQFSDFYDPNYLTINFHLILHLADLVELLGPMWVFTCFPLENLNGIILSLVHGTRWAEMQIASSIQTCLALPTLIADLSDESKAKQFCVSVVNRRKYKGKEVIDGTVIVGPSNLVQDSPLLLNKPPHTYSKMYKFNCIKREKFMYTAMSYSLTVNRDSTAALYEVGNDKKMGLIVEFLRLFQCGCPDSCSCQSNIVVVVQELQIVHYFKTLLPGVFVPNVHGYSELSSHVFINPEQLRGVGTKMVISEQLYIAKPLNSKEIE